MVWSGASTPIADSCSYSRYCAVNRERRSKPSESGFHIEETYTPRSQWKVMVLDAGSRRLVDGAVKEDDILKENITSIYGKELRT